MPHRPAYTTWPHLLPSPRSWISSHHVQPTPTHRAEPRHVVAPGRLIIWRPVKPTFFKLFRRRTGLAKRSEGACANYEYLRINSFACGNLSFRLFQWRLSAPYGLAPRADTRLARPLNPALHTPTKLHGLSQPEGNFNTTHCVQIRTFDGPYYLLATE